MRPFAKFMTATFLFFGVAACSSNPYRYEPAQNRATNTRENNEALYNLPAINPSGSLRIQYLGIENKRLHLRVVASNSSSTGNWEVNSDRFFISFPNGSKAQPVAASPSSLKVRPGSLLPMDLYFELPRGMHSADQLPEFDLHWQVQAIGRDFAKTTPFDRVRVPELHNSNLAQTSDSISQMNGGWWG